MQTTLKVLANAEPALRRLAAQKVSVKPAYHIARLLDVVRGETAEFHKQHDELVRRLGKERPLTSDEQKTIGTGVTSMIEVTPDNREEFAKKLAELEAIEVTIDKWLMTIDLLEGFAVSADDIASLGPLVLEPAAAAI